MKVLRYKGKVSTRIYIYPFVNGKFVIANRILSAYAEIYVKKKGELDYKFLYLYT